MILLIAFAFLAGIVTVLSPCILPILPIVLSSTISGGAVDPLQPRKRDWGRPFGVVTGFILSFTFFTLFLSTIVSWSGIPADSLRLFSVIVIFVFGVSLLIPQFQVVLERLFSVLSRFAPQGGAKAGFFPGLVIGLSIGLLWTPCVGPILASVISLAIAGTVTINAFFITFAYALGTAIPMFAIIIGGQSLLLRIPGLLANTSKIQKAFGIIMILTAIAIFFNYDRKFQTYVLNTFPQYGVGLTKFEENATVQQNLDQLNGKPMPKEDMGKPMFDLQPKGVQAPELIQGGEWFNPPTPKASEGQVLKSLRGKVVIVDFWTYSCINCQRTLPYLKKWYEKYKDKGLVIIGVHAPEFAFEKEADNVQQAIKDFGITYPVMQDNDFATWRAYDNHFWPAKYIIDKDGYIRYTHFGEGAYDETEEVIQGLLQEAGSKDVSMPIDNPSYTVEAQTPETYVGYQRMERFVSPEQVIPDASVAFSAPEAIPLNNFAFRGTWNVMGEYANPQKGGALVFNFTAKEVYLVMKPTDSTPARVKVFIDDQVQDFGADNQDGIVTVDGDRLYKLISLPSAGNHVLRLEFEDSNAALFAFTFG